MSQKTVLGNTTIAWLIKSLTDARPLSGKDVQRVVGAEIEDWSPFARKCAAVCRLLNEELREARRFDTPKHVVEELQTKRDIVGHLMGLEVAARNRARVKPPPLDPHYSASNIVSRRLMEQFGRRFGH